MDVRVEIFDVIIVLALAVGDILLLAPPLLRVSDLCLSCGLLAAGVDSAELLIGDNDGMCCCFREMLLWDNREDGGGDGVIERDSAKRVYRSMTCLK